MRLLGYLKMYIRVGGYLLPTIGNLLPRDSYNFLITFKIPEMYIEIIYGLCHIFDYKNQNAYDIQRYVVFLIYSSLMNTIKSSHNLSFTKASIL